MLIEFFSLVKKTIKIIIIITKTNLLKKIIIVYYIISIFQHIALQYKIFIFDISHLIIFRVNIVQDNNNNNKEDFELKIYFQKNIISSL